MKTIMEYIDFHFWWLWYFQLDRSFIVDFWVFLEFLYDRFWGNLWVCSILRHCVWGLANHEARKPMNLFILESTSTWSSIVKVKRFFHAWMSSSAFERWLKMRLCVFHTLLWKICFRISEQYNFYMLGGVICWCG